MEPCEDGESRDARLVAGLRRGAPGAFAGLHDEYAAGIYTLALRMVRHAPDAEDITQDVLLRAYERLPREREVLLRPWLYRLTLNRCYDHLRAVARRRPATPAGGFGGRRGRSRDGHGAEAELESPVDLFEQSELQRLLEAALCDLTRRQRAALLLKDVHGLSLVEVAACLELTPGSVEVLLARARKAFRASFEGHCRAAGRPAPRSAGLLAGLPMLTPCSLPLAPPALPHVPTVPGCLPPVAGGGIGGALFLPASLKTAALVLAAAATVGTAEVAVMRGEAPPIKHPAAVVLAPAAAAAVGHTRAATPSPRPGGSARAVAVPPSPAATLAAAPAPSPTASADPSASPTPLGIPTPTPTPDATPRASPTATATPEPSLSPSPEPSLPPPSPSSSPAPTP